MTLCVALLGVSGTGELSESELPDSMSVWSVSVPSVLAVHMLEVTVVGLR